MSDNESSVDLDALLASIIQTFKNFLRAKVSNMHTVEHRKEFYGLDLAKFDFKRKKCGLYEGFRVSYCEFSRSSVINLIKLESDHVFCIFSQYLCAEKACL